jgi:hypothetical protein
VINYARLCRDTKIAAPVRAAGARIKLKALAQGCVRDTWTAAQCGGRHLIGFWLVLTFIYEVIVPFGEATVHAGTPPVQG